VVLGLIHRQRVRDAAGAGTRATNAMQKLPTPKPKLCSRGRRGPSRHTRFAFRPEVARAHKRPLPPRGHLPYRERTRHTAPPHPTILLHGPLSTAGRPPASLRALSAPRHIPLPHQEPSAQRVPPWPATGVGACNAQERTTRSTASSTRQTSSRRAPSP